MNNNTNLEKEQLKNLFSNCRRPVKGTIIRSFSVLIVVAIVFLCFFTIPAMAATTLSVGDIAFVGINSDGDDEFSFLLLKDITAGTSVYITDKGWNDGTGFSSISGDGIWKWTTNSNLDAGTVVNIKTTNNGTIEPGSLIATPGSVEWNELNGTVISYAGDQVFLYQGDHLNPTLITGIHYNVEPNLTTYITNNDNWDGSSTSNSTSALPDQLTNGVNAIWVYDQTGTTYALKERDNFKYNGSTTGTPDELRSAINNISNWDVDDKNTTPYNIQPSEYSFTVLINAEPTLSIANTTLAYTENNAATQIDAAGTVSDSDGDADWNGGTLEIQITANSEAADEISISDTDGDGTAITISGTNILANGTDIGDLTANGGIVTGGTLLTIIFDSDATNAIVQEVLQSLRYRNTSNNPGTSNRTITITASDASSASASDTRTISVTAVNDEPTLTATGSNPTFTEDGSAVAVFSNTSASTVESGQTLSGFTMTVTNVNDGSNERLNVDGTTIVLTHGTSGTTASNSLSYSVSVVGTTATVNLSGGTLSTSTFQTLINSVSYRNNSNMPNTSNRVVTITSLTDSGGTANGGDDTACLSITSTVTVVAINDAPTLSNFTSVVETTTQNTEIEITLEELKAQGNEADVDGTVDAFIVNALSSGTLKIGANAATATPFNLTTNKTINATNNAYWTPDNGDYGTKNAFTTTVLDNNGAESTGAVQATVNVSDVTKPEISSITISGSPSAAAASITYIVTFTEPVVNVSTDDFSLTNVGSVNGSIDSVSAPFGTNINVTVNNITGTGSLRLDLNTSTNIADASANTPPAAYNLGAVHTVDRDNPILSSSVPADGATGFLPSSNITLTFNENIVFGTGNIQIIDLDDGSSTVTIDAALPGGLASISANTLTLNPASDLEENTNCAVQLAATAIDDSNGNSYSGILDNTTLNFTVSAPPVVVTNATTSITATAATLNGTVDANNQSTVVSFEYGTTTSYGTTITADQSPVTGTTNIAVSKRITGLTPNSTYHYRVVGVNACGTTYGADYTFTTTAAPEMNIKGSGTSIGDGDTTPELSDHTDFGSIDTGETIIRTFTIENTGSADLTLDGTPKVEIKGADKSNFTVTLEPTSPIAVSNTRDFEITFQPDEVRTYGAIVSITNNDSDENPYTFTIQGEGTEILASEINIKGNGTSITSGDTTPDLTNHTDFGSINTGETVIRTFTIENIGTADLTLDGTPKVEIKGADKSNFTVTLEPTSPIDAGDTKDFEITFQPDEVRTYGAIVSITNNDSDENPYTFTIQGRGTETLVSEINIKGNGTSITSGDTTPDLTDHTDFGSVNTGRTVIRTFTIENTGIADLTLDGTPKVEIKGADKSNFTVTLEPTNPIDAGDTKDFEITFQPDEVRTYGAIVSITNNDSNENPYTFSIIGAGSRKSNSHNKKKEDTNNVQVKVDGDSHNNIAEVKTTKEGNVTLTHITLNQQSLEQQLRNQDNNKISLEVSNQSDGVQTELNGQMIKTMEGKKAVLEIKTEKASYTLPAEQINIDAISEQLGEKVALKDIQVNIEIHKITNEKAKIIKDTENKESYTIIAPPIEFKITCTKGSRKIEVDKFNAYIERTILIPAGVDPYKITTGVIVNSDGTVNHVPTKIIKIDGKYYAKINSLTNSTYSVIWNEKGFDDVTNHWAKDAINDMGSRLVIGGIGNNKFEPDRDITRAEYATIVVKALGLMKPGTGKDLFNDVSESAWYYDAIYIANEYGLISGYGNGEFGPDDKITREQAMAILSRAMQMTKINVDLGNDEANQILGTFNDSKQVTTWAEKGVASCVQIGIVSGKGNKILAPQDKITRAEVAVIVRRLLQKSSLI